MLDWLYDRMAGAADQPAVAEGNAVCSYRALLERVAWWERQLADRGVHGCVVSIEAEYGAESIAVFLAATNAGNVLVPISNASRAHRDTFLDVAEVEYRILPQQSTDMIVATGRRASHDHYAALKRSASP